MTDVVGRGWKWLHQQPEFSAFVNRLKASWAKAKPKPVGQDARESPEAIQPIQADSGLVAVASGQREVVVTLEPIQTEPELEFAEAVVADDLEFRLTLLTIEGSGPCSNQPVAIGHQA